MVTTEDHTRLAEEKTQAHPYLARQMSNFRFWQTLMVRTLGCTRRSHPLPTHVSSPRKDLNYTKNNTEDTRFILVQATIVV